MQKVRANFDFEAQPGSGELSIHVGEELNVIRKGIDGGWMEGQNAKGKVGLFPESYVTVIVPSASSLPPPTIAPPPLPPNVQPMPVGQTYTIPPSSLPAPSLPTKNNDPWDDPRIPIAPTFMPPSSAGGSSTNPPPSAPAQLSSSTGTYIKLFSRGQQQSTSGAHQERRSPSITEEQKLATAGDIGTNGRPHRSQSRTTSDSRTDLSVEEVDEDAATITDDLQSVTTAEALSVITKGSGDIKRSGNSSAKEDLSASPSKKEFSAAQGSQRNVARSRSTGPDVTSTTGKQMGTAKMKTINRFSNFVKTGMESFILAASKMNTQPGENHIVMIRDNRIEWQSPPEFYTCVVSKPKKESKLKGLKSFIAYSLTCSLSGIQVSRRYKHFDWLHEQLSNKYILISIPPLPEKQVAGRFEEDLIEYRKNVLQLWTNKICRHPVLSQSEDEYVGGNFFHCIQVPNQTLDSKRMEDQIDNFAKCIRSLDDSVRELHDRVTDNQKRLIGPYKSNWQKMAGAFDLLGKSLDQDPTQPNNPVKNAIKTSAHALFKIGSQHEEHGKKDMEQLLDFLYIYKGLFANIPDIVNVHKSALSKIRDNERLRGDGKLSIQDADGIHQRVDVTTYAMMAEINHFNTERDNDFRQMFGDFFAQQAAFYTSVGQQMQQLADLYKN
ncbi:WASP-binding domain of sorting nexin protein [Ditylenchus destructor]|nr:WASP-binding domain of sorting nexin protein [Ditylenchus destructor]